jgi:hypothetical protein
LGRRVVTRDGVYYLEQRADMPLSQVALKFLPHGGAVKLLREYSKPPNNHNHRAAG